MQLPFQVEARLIKKSAGASVRWKEKWWPGSFARLSHRHQAMELQNFVCVCVVTGECAMICEGGGKASAEDTRETV